MKLFGSITELVSAVFRKNSQQITFRPNQATTYTASRDIQTPPQDADSILVSQDATQTLTNKTINGASNTLTVRAASDITGQLPTANGGTGQNSTATFPTSGVVVTEAATETLTNKTINGSSNTLTVLAGSQLSGQVPTANGGTGQNSTATFPTSGIVVTEAATETLTNKTISGSSNTLTVLAGSQLSGQTPIPNGGTGQSTANAAFNALAPSQGSNSGKFLTTNGTDTSWATPAGAQNSAEDLKNHSITSSVAANALTIALKDQSGSDASAGSPVNIAFRSSTLANGTWNVRSVTAALSMVVSSGSTLGHSSGEIWPIYIYALDNSGTVELAVSTNLFDDGTRQSTTAEGGAGAADSSSVLYSTTARSNVPIRLIGKLLSNQTAAGTWATTPTVFESYVPDVAAKTVLGDQGGSTVPRGYIGEVRTATRTFTNATALTTGTDATVCSFSLDTGIWLVSGCIGLTKNGATTLNAFQGAIINGGTSTAGFVDQYANVNFSTAGTIAINNVFNGGSQASNLPIMSFPILYVPVTTATMVNLVAQATFGTNTCSAYGSMNAVRVA